MNPIKPNMTKDDKKNLVIINQQALINELITKLAQKNIELPENAIARKKKFQDFIHIFKINKEKRDKAG